MYHLHDVEPITVEDVEVKAIQCWERLGGSLRMQEIL